MYSVYSNLTCFFAGMVSQATNPSPASSPLSATDLSLRDRPDPTHSNVDSNGHRANDVEGLGVVLAALPEDDGEDDATKVARSAGHTGHDAVGMRVNVRHQSVVGAVACFQKKRHAGDEAEHGVLLLRVQDANGDQEGSGDDGETVKPNLFGPGRAGFAVDVVSHDATDGAEDHVEETKHGSPVATSGLAERLEVLKVVCTQDGVDRQLCAEGAEVAGGCDESLHRENNRYGFLEGRLLNNLASRSVEHLLLWEDGFVVVRLLALACCVELHFLVGCWGSGRTGVGLLVHNPCGCVDDGCVDAVACKVVLHSQVAIGPFAGWSIRAQEQQAAGHSNNADTRHYEGDAPCHVRSKALLLDEAVVDSGHQEISDASTSITEASSESIACADDVLVEKASHPHLTWHEAATEDTDEEAQGIELTSVERGTGEERRDGTNKQAAGEGPPRTEMIACWPGHQTNEERCGKGDDVGVGDLDFGQLKIFLDGDIYLNGLLVLALVLLYGESAYQWWESIP